MNEALQGLRERCEDAALVCAWESDPSATFGVPGRRWVLVYTVSDRSLNGLRHWPAELAWYAGEVFVVAMEASVFARLLLQKHPMVTDALAPDHSPLLEGTPDPLQALRQTSALGFDEVSAWLDAQREARRRRG